MKPTSILALLTAFVATGVQAHPNPSLTERQATIAIVRFYQGNGCEEPWREDTVFFQSNECAVNEYTREPYGSFNIINNSFTRTGKSLGSDISGHYAYVVCVVRLFATEGCSTEGNYIDVGPGVTGCYAGQVISYSFL
jgi:hypothetical protein